MAGQQQQQYQQQHQQHSAGPSPVSAGMAPNSHALPPPLEPRKQPAAVAGPTPTSNWVVAGAVCCGARPVTGQIRHFAALASHRFNAFVCLTESDSTPEYVPAYKAQSGEHDIATRHLPLKDGQMFKAPMVGPFFDLVEEVARNVEAGSWRVYVHCAQGHGRTGLFIAALLWRLYGLPAMKAANYCDALHSCRAITEEQSSPQTQDQRTGIVSLLQQRSQGPTK
jgi:protein-tyrosine phosphatase